MKRFLIIFLAIYSFSGILIGQPSNYSWIAEFDGNYANSRLFSDGAANSTIRSLVVQATSTTDEYLIHADNYANKWQNTSSPMNSVFTLYWGLIGSPNGVIVGGVQSSKYYTFQIEGLAYSNRNAVIMETDNTPQLFHATTPISQLPVTVYPGQDVAISVTLAGNKSVQEKVFIRYTSNDFATSAVAEASGIGSTWSTATATIPGSINTAGATIKYYAYSTTVEAVNESNHDLISLKIANNSGSNYSYTVQYGWTTASDGNWSSSGTWTANAVPSTSNSLGALSIGHNVTLNQSATVSSLTIDNGKVFDGGSSILTITASGILTNNGTFTANSGTVKFSGSGSVGGTSATTFNKLEIAGGVSIGGGNTINNRLVINSGGYLSQTAGGAGLANDSDIPNYATNATLVFTGTFDINSLASGWGTTTNKFPNNLSIEGTSVTTLSFAREITGSVDIAIGATFNSGGNLTLGSTASSNASLLNLGTFNGNATIERYIGAWGTATQGWHFLSSPVAGQTFQNEFVPDPPTVNEDFYLWDEPGSQWVNSKSGSDPFTFNVGAFGTTFVTGKGYLVSYASNFTKNFVGVPNTSSVSDIALTYTPASAAKGWNLLGNPFPSGLTWNVTAWKPGNTTISGTAKIVKSADASYEDITAGEVIPAMNGFFVYTSASTTLTIPAGSRTHGSDWFKQTSTLSKFILKVIDLDGQTAQKTQLILNPDASAGFDFLYDSEFLPFLAPSLYTVVEGKQLSTNSIPAITGNLLVPVHFVKNNGSNFVLEAENVSAFGTEINLVDKKTGIVTNLNQNPTYSFTSENSDDPARFDLHFGLVGLSEQTQSTQLKAYASNGRLYFPLMGDATLEVIDLQGRKLTQTKMSGTGLTSHPMSLTAGAYIVRLRSETGIQTAKVIVK